MIRRSALVAALSMAACNGFSQPANTASAKAGNQVWTSDTLRALLQPLIDNKAAVGISVGVATASGTVLASVGTTAQPGTPQAGAVDADTLFEIASITKALTGTLLADMVERKLLQLDDPIGPALQALAGQENHAALKANTALAAVTWRQLTTHTAGIARIPMTQVAMLKAMAANPQDPYAAYSRADFLDYLGSLTPTPNATYDYSNSGAALQGLLLGQVAGMPYGQLLDERLLQPLGMTDTYLQVPDAQLQRFAAGHDGKGKPTSHWRMGIFAPAGGLKSSVRDLLKVVQACLAQRPPFKLAQAQLSPLGKVGGIGMNWHMMRITQAASPKDLDTLVWHNGATFGASSFLGVDTGRGFGVVVLINSGVAPLADVIAQHLWDQRLPAPGRQK